MTKRPSSLASRLTRHYAGAFALFLAAAFIALYAAVSALLSYRMDEDLSEDIEEFQHFYHAGGDSELIAELQKEAATEDPEETFLRLLDGDGKVLYVSNLHYWPGLATRPDLLRQVRTGNSDPVLHSAHFDDQDYPARIVYGYIAPNRVLHIGESTEENGEILQVLLAAFVLIALLILPLSWLVSRAVARRAVSGLAEIGRAAADIERGDLSRRVQLDDPGAEIQQLADGFNAMAERIRSLVKEMREMIDNIAHDLRSPITRIRVLSEHALSQPEDRALIRNTLSDTLVECDRVIHLINTTLDVAEAESGVGQHLVEEINLSEMTEGVCELFEALAEEKGVQLNRQLMPGRRVYGNQGNLQRMIANLLDNAIKYTPAGGHINIHLRSDNDGIQLVIADDGGGIPLQDQSRVFDRYYRGDQSRRENGCGLGLSFARAVVRAHGGEISVSSAPGEGSTFTVAFPPANCAN